MERWLLLTDEERAVLHAAERFKKQFLRCVRDGEPLTEMEKLWEIQKELLVATTQ